MNVPKLRFSGFNNSYITEKLNKLVAIYDGTHETPNYTSSGVKFVSVENINNLLHSDKYISLKDFDKYKIKPKYNDVFMTRIGDIGTSAIYKSNDNLAYYVSLALLRTKNQLILNPDYLNQYIKSSNFQKELYKRTIHVAFPKKINTGEIGECDITIPEYIEQKRISKFLSILDKKIELQSKKVEALKLFKLSIKNKLFKTNNNYEIRINQLVKCESSNLTLSDIQDSDGAFPIYGAEGFIKNINFYNHNHEYIGIVKDGAGVGRVMVCPSKSSTISTMNALVPILEYKASYILELLNSINFKKYIIGSGIPHIYFKDYGKEKIKIHNIDESNKITKLFDLINKKIDCSQYQIGELKKLKKWLLQNMFI